MADYDFMYERYQYWKASTERMLAKIPGHPLAQKVALLAAKIEAEGLSKQSWVNSLTLMHKVQGVLVDALPETQQFLPPSPPSAPVRENKIDRLNLSRNSAINKVYLAVALGTHTTARITEETQLNFGTVTSILSRLTNGGFLRRLAPGTYEVVPLVGQTL